MNNRDRLFQIANCQQGYFTCAQATQCGYSRTNFHRYIASGEWAKEQRSIYRLARYPVTSQPDPDLVMWGLWTRDMKGGIQGVWSHETALELYELSDVMSAKFHMTVPKKFRKWIEIPEHFVLRYADLSSADFKFRQGYLVTTPLKTILDVVEEGRLSKDLIVQAIGDALNRGLLYRKLMKETGNEKLIRILNEYNL
jgi:predicted transcriptional regulator of viral defense system